MSTIKVVAGDLDKGSWQFNGMFGAATMSRASTTKRFWTGESIDLKAEVENIEQLTEEKVKNLLERQDGVLDGPLVPLRHCLGASLLASRVAGKITSKQCGSMVV